MHIRKILIAAASIAVLAPAISNASAERVALKACANAFVSSITSKDGTAPTFKLNYSGGQPAGTYTEYYRHDYRFVLSANDPKTGSPLARATCSATTQGTILSLLATPLDSSSPTLAAQF
jgi:hypothetical protein